MLLIPGEFHTINTKLFDQSILLPNQLTENL